MFNKKDYILFVEQLFQIELGMEQEARELQAMVDNPKAKKLLQHIIDDEIKHQGIVNDMKGLV